MKLLMPSMTFRNRGRQKFQAGIAAGRNFRMTGRRPAGVTPIARSRSSHVSPASFPSYSISKICSRT